MSLPQKDESCKRKRIHHWLSANEDSTTSGGLDLDQGPNSDGPARIHDWLEKGASGPEAESAVSRLSGECVKAARNALRDMKTSENIPKLAYRSLERSTSSFILWVDGHRVAEGQLDDALGMSRMLRRSMLKLLISISDKFSKELMPQLVTHSCTQLLGDLILQAKAELYKIGEDSDSEDSISEDDEIDASPPPRSVDWEDIADDLRTDVECLMDLESMIESPFIDPMEPKRINVSTANSLPGSGCQFYSDMIAHRFPRAQLDLTERLATANWNRLLRVLDERNQSIADESESETPTAHRTTTVSEKGSYFHDSGLGTSVAAVSEYAETVMSYRKSNNSSIKIPPMPEEGKKKNPFECLACGRRVTMASNSAWKRHLYTDLRPWVCHQISCNQGIDPFHSRESWIQHLALDHGLSDEWESLTCPLCLEDTGSGKLTFINHLSYHLEEIALSALPANVEYDSESSVNSEVFGLPKPQDGTVQYEHDGLHSSKGLTSTIVPMEEPTGTARNEENLSNTTKTLPKQVTRLQGPYATSDTGKMRKQNGVEEESNPEDRKSRHPAHFDNTATFDFEESHISLSENLQNLQSLSDMGVGPTFNKDVGSLAIAGQFRSGMNRSSKNTETFTCSVCLTFQGDVASLREHLRCHEKSYACIFAGCNRTFSTSRDLRRHTKSAHSNTSVVCTICSAAIKGNRLDNLRRHMRTQHQV